MIIIRNQQHKSLFNMPIKKIETVYYGYNMELVSCIPIFFALVYLLVFLQASIFSNIFLFTFAYIILIM